MLAILSLLVAVTVVSVFLLAEGCWHDSAFLLSENMGFMTTTHQLHTYSTRVKLFAENSWEARL
jgi:hypothetical protein